MKSAAGKIRTRSACPYSNGKAAKRSFCLWIGRGKQRWKRRRQSASASPPTSNCAAGKKSPPTRSAGTFPRRLSDAPLFKGFTGKGFQNRRGNIAIFQTPALFMRRTSKPAGRKREKLRSANYSGNFFGRTRVFSQKSFRRLSANYAIQARGAPAFSSALSPSCLPTSP